MISAIASRLLLILLLLCAAGGTRANAVVKVACIGDSITAGYKLDTTAQNYPTKLATALGSGYAVTNYGVSGKTAMIASRDPDNSYWATSQFTSAKASQPNIVILMLGSNDAKTTNDARRGIDQVNFVADYKALIDAFKNLASAPTVYVCTPYFAAQMYPGAEAFSISDITVNTIIKPWVELMAVEKNCPLININGVQSGALANYLANDTIHPNGAGYSLIANAISQAILSGVTTTPTLNKTRSSLTFAPVVINWPTALNFTLSATQLTGPITLSVPDGQGFAFKIGAGSFVTSTTLTPVNGVIPMTNVTVRLIPTEVQNYSATLSLSGGGVATQTVALTGSGLASAVPLMSYLNTSFSAALGTLPNATYALISGTLPPGLVLNTSTGVISGIPTGTGSFSPSFTATTSDGVYTILQAISIPVITAIIQESFNYPVGTNNPDPDGGINASNGLPATNPGGNPAGTSTGFYGTWGTTTDVVAGLNYTQSTKTLITTGNAGRINNATWSNGSRVNYRNMTSDPYLALRTGGLVDGAFGANGNTLYLSLLVTTSSTALNAARFILTIEDSNPNLLVGITSTGTWGMDPAGTYISTDRAAVINTPTLLVFRFILGNNNSDTLDMWVNPALGTTLGTPHATKSAMNFGFRGINTIPAVANAMTLDEIRFGTTYAAVTPYIDTSNGMQIFRNSQGLAPDGSQDLLTPAGDGVKSILKFAFDMIGSGTGQASTLSIPNTQVLLADGNAGLPLVGKDDSGKLTLTYTRRKSSSNPGIKYAVQFSNAITTWATNSSATESVTSLDSTFERVIVSDSTAANPRRFVRVKVDTL